MFHSAFAVFALSFATAPALASAQGIAPPVRTRVDYRVQPFVDMHFWVRSLAAKSDELPKIAGLEPAVLAARAIDAELQSPLAWGPIEGLFGEIDSVRKAREVFAQVPEKTTARGGKEVELRKLALKLADALVELEPVFVEKIWPEHERAIDAAREEISELFTPKESMILEFHAKSLGFTDDGRLLPVYLVFEEPFPGSVTQRDDSGRGVCFVSVQGASGTLLVETMIHELTHAFDVADQGDNVLARIRKLLESKGVTPRDREYRDVPHTLMFVQAGETVQRMIDPKHVHYGVQAGYYKKVQSIADVELAIWKAHLDGKKTRDEAIEEIVRATLAARTGK